MLDIVKRMDEKYVMTGETGSYRYMAPEVFRHEAYSEKVDIYSLACVMFFLFMGEPPLASLQPLMAARSAAVAGKRATLRPNIDKRIAALIERCWHGDASQRPSAAEACKVLEGVLADMGDSSYSLREGAPSCGCTLA
jgi:serine/threonine protein kinase